MAEPPLLADESCDFSVVRLLRAEHYDVAAIAEISPGANDEAVIEMALAEKRILLTEDKDFGQLVYAAAKASTGVILLRFPASSRNELPLRVLELLKCHGQKLVGCFVVLQPTKVRFSRLP